MLCLGLHALKKIGSVGWQQLFILFYFLFCLRLIFCFDNKTLCIIYVVKYWSKITVNVMFLPTNAFELFPCSF